MLANGYEFAYTPLLGAEYAVMATPAVAGITGDTNLILQSNAEREPEEDDLTAEPAEGAEENQEIVFSRIRQASLDLIAELTAADGDAETARQVLAFIDDPQEISKVLNGTDQNGDDRVTFAEINAALSTISPDFAAEVDDELILGAAGEQVSNLPGARLEDLSGRPSDLLSYENACDLTKSFVTSPGLANSLCQKLAAAEDAEARENFDTRDEILVAYQDQVAAQAGKSIVPAQALKLIVLAEILKAE